MTQKKKISPKKIPFLVDSIDPLGQGVCKQDGKITFIAKTLPGESGSARLFKSGKGVSFARLETLDHASSEREEPACPHYNDCPGCHYLHTGYDAEIRYKKQSLSRLLQRLGIDSGLLEVIPATSRLGYRNRIQLHYRHKYIGMIDALADTVVEIPECRLIRSELQPVMQALYTDKSWAKSHPGAGHCELYLKDGKVHTEWNGSYAHGGFSQVNNSMNELLCSTLAAYMLGLKAKSVLDLFAGDGNLTNCFSGNNEVLRVMVDSSADNRSDSFFKFDLFDDNALRDFRNRSPQKRFDLMVLDPPRKGFPDLSRWVKEFKPKNLAYVSCNPATLARDLESLEGKCRVERVILIDLFPSTYHFETVALLSF